MNQLLDAIKAELKQQPIKYDYKDIHTLMEYIWRSHIENNPIDNGRLRELNEKMDPILSSVPVADSDTLFFTFWKFCEEYGRESFLEGFCIGARLMLELQESPADN